MTLEEWKHEIEKAAVEMALTLNSIPKTPEATGAVANVFLIYVDRITAAVEHYNQNTEKTLQ